MPAATIAVIPALAAATPAALLVLGVGVTAVTPATGTALLLGAAAARAPAIERPPADGCATAAGGVVPAEAAGEVATGAEPEAPSGLAACGDALGELQALHRASKTNGATDERMNSPGGRGARYV